MTPIPFSDRLLTERLSREALATSTTLLTAHPMTLNVGDTLIVSPTTANSESATVSAIDGCQITLSGALSNNHASGDWVLNATYFALAGA